MMPVNVFSGVMNQHLFCNCIFKWFLIFVPVHVEDKAQHGGWIFPGWEEHDLVACESNTIEISVKNCERPRLTASLIITEVLEA